MLVESEASAVSRRNQVVPLQFRYVEPSGALGESVVLLANGKESMPVSSYPARLARYLVELGREVVVEPAHAPFSDTILGESLFPAIIDTIGFAIESAEKERLEFGLKAALDAEPIEDGINHPAELVIGAALQSADRSHILACLEALSVDVEHSDLSALVLRCLGRLRPGTAAWRAGVVRSALAAGDLEMRDAAVQAAESWGGEEMQDVLRGHVEGVSWLRAYIQDVVDDLEA